MMPQEYLDELESRGDVELMAHETALQWCWRDQLRIEGKDRPLHWEKWTDAVNALRPVPYRKGALFLDRLRREAAGRPLTALFEQGVYR